MYPVCTGRAALQRRVRRGQTSAKAAEVFDLSGFSDFLPALLRGPEGPHYPHGRIHQLWNRTGVPTQVLDKTALAFCASLYRESLGLMSGSLSRTQNDCSRHNQIVQDLSLIHISEPTR